MDLAAANDIDGVPDISAGWYRDITALAADAPAWLRALADIGTEAMLVLFGVLMIARWWRARGHGAHELALATLAPVATVLAYGISELVKLAVHEQRPCRALPGVAETIAECPPPGDWSLPSNHATIAAAAAVTLSIAWRRATVVLASLALLAGFSRVFVGVHYPHDVLAGMAIGAGFALVMLPAVRPGARLIRRLRVHVPLLTAR